MTTSEREGVEDVEEAEEEVEGVGGGGVSVEAKTSKGDDNAIAAARASAVTFEASCDNPGLASLSPPSTAARARSEAEPRRGARGVRPRRWA